MSSRLQMAHTLPQPYPFNLAVIHGVMCSICRAVVPLSQIDAHELTHLPPKYLAPKTQSNKIKKLDFERLISGEETSGAQSDIKSFFQDERPQTEQVRKPATPLQSSVLQIRDCSIEGAKRPLEPESCIQTDDGLMTLEEDKQNWEELQISQKINLPVTKMMVRSKKQIKIFTAQDNSNSHQRDNAIYSFKKKPQNFIESEDRGYDIVPYPVRGSPCTVHIVTSPKPPIQPKIYVNGRSPPFDANSKLGESTKGSFFTNTASKFGSSSNKFGKTSKSSFECAGCSGFYCQHCGSDIPPQYRPVKGVGGPGVKSFWEALDKRDSILDRHKKDGAKQCKNCNHESV